MRGEEIEARHRVVCAGDEPIDLIRFGGEQRVVARERLFIGTPRSVRRLLEHEREPLDAA